MNKLRAEIVEKLNRFSNNKTPFVAVLSYDKPEEDIVCELENATKFGIEFKFANLAPAKNILNLGSNFNSNINLRPNSNANFAFNFKSNKELKFIEAITGSASFVVNSVANFALNSMPNSMPNFKPNLSENSATNSIQISAIYNLASNDALNLARNFAQYFTPNSINLSQNTALNFSQNLDIKTAPNLYPQNKNSGLNSALNFTLNSALKYSLSKSPLPFETYKKSFDKVIDYAKSGDIYLLNLCFETPVQTTLSLDEIYKFSSANLVLKYKNFVCFTPEIFVEIKNDKITTHPMKGTIDANILGAREILLADEKEFSEQAMITDLMRNDLSMVADEVRVERFRYFSEILTKGGRILQTSSEISGVLRGEFRRNFGDVFAKLLPVGSISGTPKIRAQEIINECELAGRGFYSGVFIYFDGKALKSWVLIRFIEQKDGALVFKSGGGITHESEAKKEYDELLKKAYFTF